MSGCQHVSASGRPVPSVATRCERPAGFLVNEWVRVCALHIAEVLRDLVAGGPVRVEAAS